MWLSFRELRKRCEVAEFLRGAGFSRGGGPDAAMQKLMGG
jgi:hypothetical protein